MKKKKIFVGVDRAGPDGDYSVRIKVHEEKGKIVVDSVRRMKPKRKTISFQELKRLTVCNSDKLPSAIEVGGKRLEYVGIGWIDVGKPTGKEVLVVE